MIRPLNNDGYEAYEHFLGPFAATSMFLRSNALKAGLEYQGQNYQGEYLGSFDASGDSIRLGFIASKLAYNGQCR